MEKIPESPNAFKSSQEIGPILSDNFPFEISREIYLEIFYSRCLYYT